MADSRNNPDLDDVFSGTTSASSGPSPQVVQMWESEFRKFAKMFGEELANQKLQRGEISLRVPLSVEEFRRQQLVNRHGPEQAAVFIQERERQQRIREAERLYHRNQALERQQHQAERQQEREAEQQRKQGPLPDLLAELSARQTSLREYYRHGGNPDDVAAKQLRAQVQEQQRHVGRKFASLSPEDQQRAAPTVQMMEQKRNELLEVEARLRARLNQELGRTTHGLSDFHRHLLGGNLPGAVTTGLESFGGAASTLAAVVPLLLHRYHQFQSNIEAGGQALYPNEANNAQLSERLRQMQQAREAGQQQVLQTHMTTEQLRARARQAGMTDAQDPQAFWNMQFGNDLRARGAFLSAFLRTGNYRQAVAAREQVQQEPYVNFLRERGLLGQNEQFQPLQNFSIPGVRGGMTTALGYQEELQANQLQRNDLDTNILQQILEEMRQHNQLLTSVNNNTNGLENLQPQWAP